jgi:hypothetical protein
MVIYKKGTEMYGQQNIKVSTKLPSLRWVISKKNADLEVFDTFTSSQNVLLTLPVYINIVGEA